MTRIDFTALKGRIIAFSFKGHSGFSDDRDIVCAALSSAVYMTANTITEIYDLPADIKIDEGGGRFELSLSFEDAGRCRELLDGLRLHVESLRDQYPENIKCTLTNL